MGFGAWLFVLSINRTYWARRYSPSCHPRAQTPRFSDGRRL